MDDSDSPPVANAVDITNIQAIIRSLGLDLDQKHLSWCEHVWRSGGRFAALPAGIPGKGMGIVAAQDIKTGEQIVHIPPKLLYTTNCIPSAVKKKYPKLSGHSLLAVGLAHELRKEESQYKLWIDTWPSFRDLQTSMPALLPSNYRGPLIDPRTDKQFLFLPPAISGTWINSLGVPETQYQSAGALPKQEAKLSRAFSSIPTSRTRTETPVNGDPLDEQTLRWMWLIVNTRSFYYDMPLRTKPKTKEDKMCLCPFMDYFNHDNEGCNVAYNSEGFTVTADRAYKRGEEVVISYGSHGNDLLWTDYGFLLSTNAADSVCIDAWMLDPSTSIAHPETRRMLEDAGYWMNYTLSKDGPCYRTETAIRTQVLSGSNWKRLTNGEKIPVSEDKIESDSQAYFKKNVLEPCIAICIHSQEAIQAMESELPELMVHFAVMRWNQIQKLAEQCLSSG